MTWTIYEEKAPPRGDLSCSVCCESTRCGGSSCAGARLASRRSPSVAGRAPKRCRAACWSPPHHRRPDPCRAPCPPLKALRLAWARSTRPRGASLTFLECLAAPRSNNHCRCGAPPSSVARPGRSGLPRGCPRPLQHAGDTRATLGGESPCRAELSRRHAPARAARLQAQPPVRARVAHTHAASTTWRELCPLTRRRSVTLSQVLGLDPHAPLPRAVSPAAPPPARLLLHPTPEQVRAVCNPGCHALPLLTTPFLRLGPRSNDQQRASTACPSHRRRKRLRRCRLMQPCTSSRNM